MDGASTSYFPSMYVADSTQTFKNGKIIPNFNAGLITNLFIENQELSNPHIYDVANGSIVNCILNGTSIYESTDDGAGAVGVYNMTIKDTLHNGSISIVTGSLTSPPNFNIEIINSPGITSISVNDGGSGFTTFNITIDATSMPISGITNVSGATISINKITNVVTGIDPETNGFNFPANYFTYSGYITKNFMVTDGQGGTISGGTNNTFFGRSSPTGKSGCFGAADSQSMTVLSPVSDYQFITRFYNGYGFNTADPKANFHVKAGAAGTLLMSASAVIADGNMSNNELNPYISSSDLIFKIKNNSGAVSSFNLNSLSGYVLTTGNQNIGGTKTFTSPTLLLEVQNPLVSNATPVNLTAETATITAGQLCGGVITLNPSLDQTLTLPNATDIDSVLGGIANNRGFWVTFVNQSGVNTTLSAGTNTNLNGSFLTAGSVVIPLLSQRIFRVIRIDNTPTYSLFG